jgi:hypothetical protein
MFSKITLLALSLFGYGSNQIGEELQFNIITASGKEKSFSLFIKYDESVQDVKTKIAQQLVKLSHGSLKEDTNFILIYHENRLDDKSNSFKEAMEKNAQYAFSSLSQDTIAIIAFEP